MGLGEIRLNRGYGYQGIVPQVCIDGRSIAAVEIVYYIVDKVNKECKRHHHADPEKAYRLSADFGRIHSIKVNYIIFTFFHAHFIQRFLIVSFQL